MITLGIIGVVAAMTIPTLMAKIQEKRNITLWKKSFAQLTMATRLISADIEENIKGLTSGEFEAAKTFAKYIKHDKVCKSNKAIEQGCMTKAVFIYRYDGSKAGYKGHDQISGGASCILSNLGALICFDGGRSGRGNVFVDTNGVEPPNTIGKDIFAANYEVLDKVQVRPACGNRTDWGPADGVIIELTKGDCTCSGADADPYGYGCSYELLYKK